MISCGTSQSALGNPHLSAPEILFQTSILPVLLTYRYCKLCVALVILVLYTNRNLDLLTQFEWIVSASFQTSFVAWLTISGCTSTNLQLTKGTLEELCTQFGISWDFPDAVFNPSIWSKQSGGSFRRYNAEEEVEAIGKSHNPLGWIEVDECRWIL